MLLKKPFIATKSKKDQSSCVLGTKIKEKGIFFGLLELSREETLLFDVYF